MQGNSSQRNRQTVNQSRDHARPQVWEPRHFIRNQWTQSSALIARTVTGTDSSLVLRAHESRRGLDVVDSLPAFELACYRRVKVGG
jgi:hypothetical protein